MKFTKLILPLALFGTAPASLWAQDAPMRGMNMIMAPMPAAYAGQADKPGAPMFTGLGKHEHSITTDNAQTQKLFDQGVNLMFGFNHAEAIRSFREAARLDSHCAMCWWGVAMALGPNINMPMPADAQVPAWQALQKAQSLAKYASPVEAQWIEALGTRYSDDSKADRSKLDAAFASAMGALWKRHPEDLDAGSFYAEAMMDTQPWDYWAADGVTPKGHATEIVSTLEGIMASQPDHPGALHLYIHAVEATTTPQRAEVAADRLLKLMPQAGHIVHMPSHIYYRVGRYEDAAKVNEQAALVDEAYIATCRAQGYYPAGYYGHNIHFLWTSSEMMGRYEASITAARRLIKAVDPEVLAKTTPQMELYAFTPVVTQVRFGRWKEVLAEPAPPPALKLETAVWLYARGFAHANSGDLSSARADRTALSTISTGDLTVYAKKNIPAQQMINLALALLDGEIARNSGNLSDAVARFQLASGIEHDIPYTEPPYWHQPVSHILGAALLQAGQPAQAETVYRESLKTYRRDGWALRGLEQALLAQGKAADAATAHTDFVAAWSLADVVLPGSRF